MVCLLISFSFLGPHVQHMDIPRLGFKSELIAADLCHSYSNMGSELRLQPTPQFTVMLDP